MTSHGTLCACFIFSAFRYPGDHHCHHVPQSNLDTDTISDGRTPSLANPRPSRPDALGRGQSKHGIMTHGLSEELGN